jgi:hypothetical protein
VKVATESADSTEFHGLRSLTKSRSAHLLRPRSLKIRFVPILTSAAPRYSVHSADSAATFEDSSQTAQLYAGGLFS